MASYPIKHHAFLTPSLLPFASLTYDHSSQLTPLSHRPPNWYCPPQRRQEPLQMERRSRPSIRALRTAWLESRLPSRRREEKKEKGAEYELECVGLGK